MKIYCHYWDEDSGACLVFPESDTSVVKIHGKSWILVHKFEGIEVFGGEPDYGEKLFEGDIVEMGYPINDLRMVEVIKIIE